MIVYTKLQVKSHVHCADTERLLFIGVINKLWNIVNSFIIYFHLTDPCVNFVYKFIVLFWYFNYFLYVEFKVFQKISDSWSARLNTMEFHLACSARYIYNRTVDRNYTYIVTVL